MNVAQVMVEAAPAAVVDERARVLWEARQRAERAERVASDMAKLLAEHMQRADREHELRLAAEETAASMAALVAHENARATDAEERAERAEMKLRRVVLGV